ncbi:MAG: hypothetical protein JKY71_02960 [Alphaproteobacteria bacterium]|nr:hypothetical protein [Alphaproteobacteria bacterium]
MKKSIRFLHMFLGCASVALLASGAAAQNVEPELQFRPAEKWSISSTDNLCTIKATFNNGFGVRLLGNEKWARALDVDFRQDVFNAGESYDATLTIPGVSTKSFKAQAQSGSLLAFGIGEDSGFYKSLKQSSVMDLAIDGNSFRFYMTGFANSARQFETCMAGVSSSSTVAQGAPTGDQNFMVNEAVNMEQSLRAEPPMEVAEITPEPPQTSADAAADIEGGYSVSSKDLEDDAITPINENADSMDEVPSRVAENPKKRLSQQLAEQIANDPSLIEDEEPYTPRKKLEVPDDIASMPIVPEEESVVTPMAEPAAETAPAETVEPDTAPPSQDTLAAPAEAETVEPATSEIIAAEAEPMPMPEAEDVPADNAEAEPVDVAEDMGTEAEPVEAAEEEEEPEAERTRIYAKTQPMKVRKETMTAEADFTHSNVNGLGKVNADLRKDVVGMEATIRELKAENEALNSELKKALRESEEERLTIASENWNLEQATMKYNEAERQISRLGQQLQKERAQCSMEKRELEAMLFDPQVTEQEQLAKLSSLERDLQAAKRELEAQRLRYEERIRLLESTQ